MKNPINICLSFDEKYAQHAAVTMVSLMKNCSRNIHFYIIDSEPSGITESRSKIVKLVEMYGAKISFRTIDLSVFKGFLYGSQCKIPPTNMCRTTDFA